MLIFGHAGLTLGIAVLSGRIISKQFIADPGAAPAKTGTGHEPAANQKVSLPYVASHIDLRLVLVGSLLPDMIDKPVGQFLFRDTFGNGRIFSHTLLFLLIIALVGTYLCLRRRQLWLLPLSLGTFTHLIFDQMWSQPRIILWPLYGFAFEKADLTHWAARMFQNLLNEPVVYIPELIGLAVLIWFTVVLVQNRKVSVFANTGQFIYRGGS